MDEIAVLQTTFAQQTVDYEHAVHDTWLASASIGPKPSNSQALNTWKEKLVKEEEIRARRADTLQKLTAALRSASA